MNGVSVALIPEVKVGVRLVFRARFVTIAFYLCLVLIGAALLSAQFSARQLATMAMDVGFSVIRLGLPLFAVLLVQELFTRELERKTCLLSLTYPRPRHWWLLGRLAAASLVLFVTLAGLGVLLGVTVWFVSGWYAQATPVSLGGPFVATLSLIYLDLLVLTAVAILLAVVATTPAFVLVGSLGLLLVARSYMPIIQLLADDHSLVEKLADPAAYLGSLSALRYFLPDLGSLDVRGIALYGKWELLPDNWHLLVLSASAYVVGLLAFSVWHLNRRELA